MPRRFLDERRVVLLVGDDPVGRRLPAHAGLVAERGLCGVDEQLMATLPAVDLAAEVARVGEDRSHGAGGPRACRRGWWRPEPELNLSLFSPGIDGRVRSFVHTAREWE